MPYSKILAFIVSKITEFVQTDGHGQLDSSSDPDQKSLLSLRDQREMEICKQQNEQAAPPTSDLNIWLCGR